MGRRHPFTGLRIVELATDPGGELLGKLFAQFGAAVTKVEPPGGAPSRAVGPFAKGQVGPDTSLNFWFYNGGKDSVVLDLAAPDAGRALDGLLAGADLLISTLQPAALKAAGLDFEAMRARFPKLIVVSVTPFGLTGPWADFKVCDLVALAAGGPLLLCGYDDHAIPPIKPGGDQAYHTAASFGQTGALLALIDRQKTGRGQVVDVSMHEATAVSVEMAFPYWVYQQGVVSRQTCRHAQPSRSESSLFLCADGRYLYYTLAIGDLKGWKAVVEWLQSHDMADDLADPSYLALAHRQERHLHIRGVLERFFLTISTDEGFLGGQARGLPTGAVYSPEDLLADQQMKARDFFVEVDEVVGPVIYPGAPYRFSAFDPAPARPAPKLPRGPMQT